MPERSDLELYGKQLVEDGFKVWLSPFGRVGYLVYEKDGLWGSFQESEFDGFEHLMPLKPSKEFGSHMHIEPAPPVGPERWTVQAARDCARATNWNSVVGTQPNQGEHWLSPSAYALHAVTFPTDVIDRGDMS
jgi:hypothetical protein